MCNEKKLDKLKAQYLIVKAQRLNKNNKGTSNNNDLTYYFCEECKAYHTANIKDYVVKPSVLNKYK